MKVVRVVKRWPVKLYTCNAGRLTNKMAILAHDAQKLKLGVIHIYVRQAYRQKSQWDSPGIL